MSVREEQMSKLLLLDNLKPDVSPPDLPLPEATTLGGNSGGCSKLSPSNGGAHALLLDPPERQLNNILYKLINVLLNNARSLI